MDEIGEITHYFGNLGVAVIDLKAELKVGDQIKIQGATTDLEQSVESIQIDRKPVESASSGQIAVKVVDTVRAGDKVFKV